jgi:adenylate cyclase
MRRNLLVRLRERGVLRVATSYAVIAWLLLQVADVTFEPMGVPAWAMPTLILVAALGFPVAVALAWFYEVGDDGLHRDIAADGVARPVVHGRRRYADLVIIGVLVLTVGVLLVRQSNLGRPPPPDTPAIAVLPFKNLGEDPGQEYFSDGLAEEVLARLGRVPGLRVIASSSSFSFKGRNEDVKSIAQKLGVTTLLEGSVRSDGRKLRINAKLIDGRTGYQVWSGTFDRQMTDVFEVQEELAAAVIEAIIPTARGELPAGPPPTTSLDAHDHYLLGIAAQRSRTTTRLAESVDHLERAVALDPSYAQAHAALANSRMLLEALSGRLLDRERAGEVLAGAERSVYKALALDATLSDAHGALGNVLRESGRPGAEEAYRRALELNPSNAIVAHNYGVLLSGIEGREADAARLMDLALALDPRSPIVWTNKLRSLHQSGDSTAFGEGLSRALQVFEDDADGLVVLLRAIPEDQPYQLLQLGHAIAQAGGDPLSAAHATLGPLIALGRYDEALERIAELTRSDEFARQVRPYRVMALGLEGDFDRLQEALAEMANTPLPKRFRFVLSTFWYSVEGKFPEAAAALEAAGHIDERGGGPMGSSMERGAVPALMRLYVAQGREGEARELAARFRLFLQGPRRSSKSASTDEVLLAGVAAAEGERALAVRHLRTALDMAPIPELFHPELPWFRTLEGQPGYAELVAELERRRAEILAQMRRLEAPGS